MARNGNKSNGSQNRNRNNSQAQKRGGKPNRRESKFQDGIPSPTTSGSNDVSWYANNPELLRAAASISFYNTNGTINPLNHDHKAVPGVCAMHWAPHVMGADGDAIQQAANSIYSYVVHANSRNYSYDPTDIMMLIMAGASLFSLVAHGIRAYGTMRRFNGQDAYTPEALINAMGFSYDDLRNNLSKMWFDINEIIARCSQIWIPNTIPLIERWFWMNSNIYRDAESAKSQYYLFKPVSYFVLDETSYETGTALEMGGINDNMSWEVYVAKVRGAIDALLDSEDRGIIFGDILKAYGSDKIYSISPISADFTIDVVYDKEVLTQIENASLTGLQPGALYQDEYGQFHQKWREYDVDTAERTYLVRPALEVLNFHQLENPTPEQVMVATRLKSLGLRCIDSGIRESDGVSITMLAPVTAGTEVILLANLWYYMRDDATGLTKLKNTALYPYFTNGWFDDQLVYAWAAFDYAPWLYTFQKWEDDPTASVGMLQQYTELYVDGKAAIGDYDNYTYVSANDLRKTHTAALYSLFGVPHC